MATILNPEIIEKNNKKNQRAALEQITQVEKQFFSSSPRRQPEGQWKKKVRANQKKCDTGGTVGLRTCKHGAPIPIPKNKYNQKMVP